MGGEVGIAAVEKGQTWPARSLCCRNQGDPFSDQLGLTHPAPSSCGRERLLERSRQVRRVILTKRGTTLEAARLDLRQLLN